MIPLAAARALTEVCTSAATWERVWPGWTVTVAAPAGPEVGPTARARARTRATEGRATMVPRERATAAYVFVVSITGPTLDG